MFPNVTFLAAPKSQALGKPQPVPAWQAVGPVAVTSLLLGNVQHGLGSLAGVSFPASVLDPATNLTVPYNPSSPGAFAPQQDLYNNAAHNVR